MTPVDRGHRKLPTPPSADALLDALYLRVDYVPRERTIPNDFVLVNINDIHFK